MKKMIINTDKAPAAVGPYSQAIKTGELLFISGQLGITPGNGEFAGKDIESQTRQALQNMSEILKEAGLDFSDVTKTTVYLDDINEFKKMNAVYAEYFTSDYPARAAFQVAALPLGGKVEIEAIAAFTK